MTISYYAVYHVGNFEYVDNEIYGEQWKLAMEKAKETHQPVYRRFMKLIEESYDVCTNDDLWKPVFATKIQDIKVF